MSANSADRDGHLRDEDLAALHDGAQPEWRAREMWHHLAGCGACHARGESLRDLAAALALAPAESEPQVAAILRCTHAEQAPARRWAAPGAAVALGGLAAAALIAVTVLPRADQGSTDDGFSARGPAAAAAAVQLKIYAARAGEDGAAALEPMKAGARLGPGQRALVAEVDHLPAARQRQIAVYVRDASGRVTWLMPAWTGGEAPACVALPNSAAVQRGPMVELPRPAPGPLQAGLLVLGDACDLRDLDARLERGWRPGSQPEPWLLSTELLELEVEASP